MRILVVAHDALRQALVEGIGSISPRSDSDVVPVDARQALRELQERANRPEGSTPVTPPLVILCEVAGKWQKRIHEANLAPVTWDEDLQLESIDSTKPEDITPLLFRLPLDLGNKTDEPPPRVYAGFSVPVIALTWFELPRADDRSVDLFEARGPAFFLDSSIWHRSVAIYRPSFLAELKSRLHEIQQNYKLGLYSSQVALLRLGHMLHTLKNSRVPHPGQLRANRHARSLFTFHSETDANERFAKEENLIKEASFYLVDDHAKKPLDLPPDCGEAYVVSKGELIGQELSELSPDAIELKTAFSEVQHAGLDGFDIILLDFYLGEDSKGKALTALDLLYELNERPSEASASAIDRHWWVFPISSFPESFVSLRELGHFEGLRETELVSGADPVSTPCLFRFKLNEFLHRIKYRIYRKQLESVETTLRRLRKQLEDQDLNQAKGLLFNEYQQLVEVDARLYSLRRSRSRLSKHLLRRWDSEVPEEALPILCELLRTLSTTPRRQLSRAYELIRLLHLRTADTEWARDHLRPCIETLRHYLEKLEKGTVT